MAFKKSIEICGKSMERLQYFAQCLHENYTSSEKLTEEERLCLVQGEKFYTGGPQKDKRILSVAEEIFSEKYVCPPRTFFWDGQEGGYLKIGTFSSEKTITKIQKLIFLAAGGNVEIKSKDGVLLFVLY